MHDWLLASELPSIRYLVLRDLDGLSADDTALQEARHQIMERGPVPAILGAQGTDGAWTGERSYYLPKYTSSHWSMLLLAELGADPADGRVSRGAESMLARTEHEAASNLHQGRYGGECFWGNELGYVWAAGLGHDPRASTVLERLALGAQNDWRCAYNEGLPCAWGAGRALWGLACIPPDRRPTEADAIIAAAADLLLEQGDLTRGDYPAGGGRVHRLWARLNWPLFYQADGLLVLRAMAALGLLDRPAVRPELVWLASQRRADGKWRGSNPYRRRTWAGLADGEEGDRWVTLQAATVLQRAGMPL